MPGKDHFCAFNLTMIANRLFGAAHCVTLSNGTGSLNEGMVINLVFSNKVV